MATASKNIAFHAAKGRLPVLQYLPPNELLIDPGYQRQIETRESQSLIRKIAQNWDWALCQPLVVSDRGGEGRLFVIDGQHRQAAAKLRGDIAQLPCVVVNYPDAAAEAASFVALNQLRRPLNGLEVFRAAVASGDDEAIAIREAVQDAGLVIASHTNNSFYKPGEIGNVGGIRKAWRQHGPGVTARALRIMAGAFRGEKILYAGTTFPGIVAVAAARPKEADDLIAAMARKGQSGIYSAIMKARGANPDLNFDRASGLVIGELLRVSRGEPEPALAPSPKVDMTKFHEGRAWCGQCERRVSAGQAAVCLSKFCKVKVAA